MSVTDRGYTSFLHSVEVIVRREKGIKFKKIVKTFTNSLNYCIFLSN